VSAPIHVVPVNDICEHDDWGTNCVCGPRVELDGRLIIHHSLDGRERRERVRARALRIAGVSVLVGVCAVAWYIFKS